MIGVKWGNYKRTTDLSSTVHSLRLHHVMSEPDSTIRTHVSQAIVLRQGGMLQHNHQLSLHIGICPDIVDRHLHILISRGHHRSLRDKRLLSRIRIDRANIARRRRVWTIVICRLRLRHVYSQKVICHLSCRSSVVSSWWLVIAVRGPSWSQVRNQRLFGHLHRDSVQLLLRLQQTIQRKPSTKWLAMSV